MSANFQWHSTLMMGQPTPTSMVWLLSIPRLLFHTLSIEPGPTIVLSLTSSMNLITACPSLLMSKMGFMWNHHRRLLGEWNELIDIKHLCTAWHIVRLKRNIFSDYCFFSLKALHPSLFTFNEWPNSRLYLGIKTIGQQFYFLSTKSTILPASVPMPFTLPLCSNPEPTLLLGSGIICSQPQRLPSFHFLSLHYSFFTLPLLGF